MWRLANPDVVAALRASRTVVYSVGSLYTSIVPSLMLRGVGAAIRGEGVRHRVLILNAKTDRETGPKGNPMGATEFVRAVARAAGESMGRRPGEKGKGEGERGVLKFVSHLVYLEGEGAPAVDVEELRGMGIVCVRVEGRRVGEGRENGWRYEESALKLALERIIDS